MIDDEDRQYKFPFYSIEEYQDGRRSSYWAGVIVGAAGIALIIFTSLWILGGYAL